MLCLKLCFQHLSSITWQRQKRVESIQDQCCIVSTLEYQTQFLCKPTECNHVCMGDGNCMKSASCQHISKNTLTFSQMQECFTYLKHFGDAVCGRYCTSSLSIMSRQFEALEQRNNVTYVAVHVTKYMSLEAVEVNHWRMYYRKEEMWTTVTHKKLHHLIDCWGQFQHKITHKILAFWNKTSSKQ